MPRHLISPAVLAVVLSLGAAAGAEPVSQSDARQMLFSTDGYDVAYFDGTGLTSFQMTLMRTLLEGRENEGQIARFAHYFGAVAISPSVFEGAPGDILSNPEGTAFAFETGLHSTDAAQLAALDVCNGNVKSGQAPCVVAAVIVPKRYRPQDVTMSVFATEAFDAYRRAEGPKAFAVSDRTRSYGLANGPTAEAEALASCNENAAKAGSADCRIVIRDDR